MCSSRLFIGQYKQYWFGRDNSGRGGVNWTERYGEPFFDIFCRCSHWFFNLLLSQLHNWRMVFFFFLFLLSTKNDTHIFTRNEIPIALSDSFFIALPLNSETRDNCDVSQCVSGDSLAVLRDLDGCEVVKKNSLSFVF